MSWPKRTALGLCVVAAFAVRALAVFPTFRAAADADIALNGLCGYQVLRGEWPVFFSDVRIGSIECYATAATTVLLGPSRVALAITALVFNWLQLLFELLLARELLGKREWYKAVPFLMIPPLAVSFWTSVPNGYAAFCALGAAVLWLAARAQRLDRPRDVAVWAVASGLVVWQSILGVCFVVPSAVWLLWKSPRRWRSARFLAPLVLGGALGFAPWLSYNAVHGFPSLNRTWATETVDMHTAVRTGGVVMARRIPELLATVDPHEGLVEAPVLASRLRPVVLGMLACGALVLLGMVVFPSLRAARDPSVAWLLLGVAGMVVLVNAASMAGAVPGVNARYALPAALVVPTLVAWLAQGTSRWTNSVFGIVALAWLIFQASVFYWPWSPYREEQRQQDRALREAVRILESERIQTVVGWYWPAYPFAYFSGERVLPWNCQMQSDHYSLRARATLENTRVAFVMFTTQPPAWSNLAAGWSRKVDVEPLYTLLIPHQNPPPSELLREVVQACEVQPF